MGKKSYQIFEIFISIPVKSYLKASSHLARIMFLKRFQNKGHRLHMFWRAFSLTGEEETGSEREEIEFDASSVEMDYITDEEDEKMEQNW